MKKMMDRQITFFPTDLSVDNKMGMDILQYFYFIFQALQIGKIYSGYKNTKVNICICTKQRKN